MEALIVRYGVVLLFLGAGIEGEPFALAGGVLAHRGWIGAWAAALAAIGGACLVDGLWFLLGRRARDHRWVRAVAARPAFARSLDLVDRHPVAFVLLFRFAYGLRAVAPVAIGASRVPARRFVPLDLAAGTIWGAGFTATGFLLGPAFEAAEARWGGWLAVCGVALSLAALGWALRGGGAKR